MSDMIGVVDLHSTAKAAITCYNFIKGMTLTTNYQAWPTPLTASPNHMGYSLIGTT